MIYVFDIESAEAEKDMEYYRDCLDGLRYYSPDAAIFLLLHKMDLVREPQQLLEKKRLELEEASGDVAISVFGTTIFDQTLYKVCSRPPLTLHSSDLDQSYQAWSSIVHTLIPNAGILSKHLSIFAQACGATEVILFERTTFLVIATSSSGSGVASSAVPTYAKDGSDHQLESTRYERTSELVKAFKYTCSRVREEFHTFEVDLPDFSAVLDELTRNTYVLVILHDPTIGWCFPSCY